MVEYGGLGGFWQGRTLNESDAFEMAAHRALGEKIKADDATACDLWCALANVRWKHTNGDAACYTFRSAGDLVAAVRGFGMYMDWYCCGDYPRVTDVIELAMKAEGWTAEISES